MENVNLNANPSAVLVMLKGEDGENPQLVEMVKDWITRMGCSIIFEAPAKYDIEACKIHYCKMLERDIYPSLEEYITSGTSYGMIVLGSRENLRELKKSVGKPVNPAPDTLRGILFKVTGRTDDKNLVHCSDVDELDIDGVNSLAMKEIANFKNVAKLTAENNLNV